MSNAQRSPPESRRSCEPAHRAIASRLRASEEAVTGQLLAQRKDTLPLLVDFRSQSSAKRESTQKPVPRRSHRQDAEPATRQIPSAGRSNPDAEAEFRVVFKQRVGTTSARSLGVLCVGRGGQVAAVDRRAAGGVGDVSGREQLGKQLDVAVSPQPAHAPENSKSGCRSWRSLTCVCEKFGAINRAAKGRSPSCRARLANRWLRSHVDGLLLASLLFSPGKPRRKRVQPVQSSGATWSV